MALETGSYISDLVASNPVASDGLGQADDHLRLIKASLKNTFAGFTSAAALNATQAQLDAAVAAVAGSTALPFKAGTVALPGLFPVGDTDTGIYAPAANQLGLAVGGVAIANISSTGINVTGGVNATGSVVAAGGVAGAAIASTGAYSGGTGQLVPIGGTLIWHEDALPAEGGYCWANGGTLSRTGYPLLWARWGTKYGAGDGSTTFNVPNLCEVVPVGQRAMGSASSRALLATGVLGTSTLGAATVSLGIGDLPAHTHANTLTDPGHGHTYNGMNGGGGGSIATGGGYQTGSGFATSTATTGITITNASVGSGTAHNNVQPSVAVNFIIRIG